MSIKDKMANAKTSDWLTRDIPYLKLKWICWSARIFAAIVLRINSVINKINGDIV